MKIANASTPYLHTGLANGTTYYYIVAAANALGEGSPSTVASATPIAPVAVPSAPTGVSVVVGNTELTIEWDAVAGATRYDLYWSTSTGVTVANGTHIAGVTSPYVHTALVDGVTYYYVVTASNAIGNGPPSTEASGAPAVPATGPAAPAGLTAMPGDGEVLLSWDPVAGATSYNIYWSTAPGVTIATGTRITGAWNPWWKQTSAVRTAAELRAAPEYFNQGAYATLFTANYPFTLPYSAGLDELRTYVHELGLLLWQVRNAQLPFAGATAAQRAAVAAERLGLTPHGAGLIATPNLLPAEIAWNTPNALAALASVPTFLQAAGTTYESLLELLEVEWVQSGAGVSIQGIDDTCMTSVQTLEPLDAGFLDRAHRFLRLWLASAYAMWELDLLLRSSAVGAGTLDDNALAAVLEFKQLQDATRLAVDQLLAFYQDLDVGNHRAADGLSVASLYRRVFLTPAVTSVAPDPDLAAIPTGGAIAAPLLADHLAGIQAALGTSAADASLLFSLTDGTLTLPNLSRVYRVNALAGSAKVSIADLLTIASLLDPAAATPWDALAPLFANPAATIAFLKQATAVRQSNLTLDVVSYLLTPPRSTTLSAAITVSDTTIAVANDSGFPSANFYVTLGTETLLVTATGGAGNTTWTVVRGQQGTTAVTRQPACHCRFKKDGRPPRR